MREKGIIGRLKRRFRRTTDSNHENPIAPNLVARDFVVREPNRVWVGDVTYIATETGWAYLAVLIDLFSRRVVGWTISETNDTELALAALHRAVRGRRFERGLVHHTDRGSPYASDAYRAALEKYGIVQSMSRKGDCYERRRRELLRDVARRARRPRAVRLDRRCRGVHQEFH